MAEKGRVWRWGLIWRTASLDGTRNLREGGRSRSAGRSMKRDFKFRYVKDGKTVGFLSSKGAVEDIGLRLGDLTLPYEAVVDTTTRDERLILTIDSGGPNFPPELLAQLQDYFLVLHVYGGLADSLEKAIDRFCSVVEAQARKLHLQAEGNGHLFRTVECPLCQCTVDLSEFPETPYSYCRFCETVFGQGLNMSRSKNNYRECDECGYHDRIQGYTEFYFYFLLVVYGYRHNRRHMCDSCAISMSNKLLAANALFLLGVPNAVTCAVRARSGRDLSLASLAQANKFARAGRLAEADSQYDQVLRNFRDHPGVRYNQAITYLKAQRVEDGLAHLRASIEACPNYLPALTLVHRLTS